MASFSRLSPPRNLSAWALPVLVIVVAFLSYQQYRWIDRITEAERKSSQEKLAGALTAFSDDFDTEITRAHMVFMGLIASSASDAVLKAREELERFRKISLYPGLIKSVAVEEGMPFPFQVDPGPPSSLTVPLMLGARILHFRAGPLGFASPGTASPLLTFPGGAVVNRGVVSGGAVRFMGERPPSPPIPMRTRIELDGVYIVNSLLPQLLERHLGPSARQHYDVLIRSHDGNSVVLQWGSDNGPWDRTHRIFAVRADCLLPSRSGGEPAAMTLSARDTTAILRQPGACSDSSRSAPGVWEVSVRGRPGSLTEAVDSARRRSLALSFGVILTLAAGIAVLFVSAHRARELAILHEQFAAGVSHELRTPLSIISSASENLADGVVENADQMRQYGKMIHAHARQLSEMIENALWFARRSPQSELELSEVDVEELVDAAAATCSGALREAGVTLERVIEPGLPTIRGNRTLLLQGLQNLLTNVARYARAGKWACIRAERQGQDVVFVVEDRGDGIPSDEAHRVFEPFYRGKEAKRENMIGLGLGLSIARRIVEAHAGKIQFHSGRNQGTVIIFTIPISGAIESE